MIERERYCFLYFLIGLCFFFANAFQQKPFPFQKKVWAYWNVVDFSQAPLSVKAHNQQLKINAQKAGFEYTLLYPMIVPRYIQNYQQKIQSVRRNSFQLRIQHISDLIRFHIIYDHGGIWLDLSSLLMPDFQWISKITTDQYKHLITNRFSQEPNSLLFYFSKYQNSAEYRIPSSFQQNQTILYNQFPGYQIWFLAAKKKDPFIGQIKQVYTSFTQTKFSQLKDKFSNEQIYMNRQDSDGYLSGNMAISYILQKKQKQLDKNLTIFGQRQTVYQYYKLWSLSAQLGPLWWTNKQVSSPKDAEYMSQPKQYFQQKGAIILFFIKFTGELTQLINQKLQNLKQLRLKLQSFDKILQIPPQQQVCSNTKFIVQDSIVDLIFKNTNYLSNIGLRPITKAEDNAWDEKCKDFKVDLKTLNTSYVNALINSLYYSFLFYDSQEHIQYYKTHETIHYREIKDFSIWKRIKLFLFANQNIYYLFYRYLVNVVLVFAVHLTFLKIVHKLFTRLRGLIQFKQGKNRKQLHTLDSKQGKDGQISYNKIDTEQNQEVKVPFESNINNQENNVSQKSKVSLFNNLHLVVSSKRYYLTVLMIVFNTTLAFMYFNFVDLYGRRDNDQITAMIVIFILYTLHLIENNLKCLNSEAKQKNSLEQLKRNSHLKIAYELFYPFIAFWIAYLTMAGMRRNKQILNIFSMIFGLIGTTLIKLSAQLEENNRSNKFLNLINRMSRQSIHRFGIGVILIIVSLFPNLKYIVHDDQYIISLVPSFGIIYLSLILIALIGACIYNILLHQTFRLILLCTTINMAFQRMPLFSQNYVWNFYQSQWFYLVILLCQFLYIQIGYNVKASAKLSSSSNQSSSSKQSLSSRQSSSLSQTDRKPSPKNKCLLAKKILLEMVLFYGLFLVEIIWGFFNFHQQNFNLNPYIDLSVIWIDAILIAIYRYQVQNQGFFQQYPASQMHQLQFQREFPSQNKYQEFKQQKNQCEKETQDKNLQYEN